MKKSQVTVDISYTLSRAEQGDAGTQRLLGSMYAEGQYIPQDHSEAFFWLSLAALAGSKDAQALREIVVKNLSSDQIATLKRRIEIWKPKPKTFQTNLSRLNGLTLTVTDDSSYPEPGQASVLITFTDGTKLQAKYWRITKDGRAYVSSFDHQQKYGLPAAFDAKAYLQKELNQTTVSEARMDGETADLLFTFSEGLKLQVFSFTGYEIWTIEFPDGTSEYSNHALS